MSVLLNNKQLTEHCNLIKVLPTDVNKIAESHDILVFTVIGLAYAVPCWIHNNMAARNNSPSVRRQGRVPKCAVVDGL